jgi:hypothetical protein
VGVSNPHSLLAERIESLVSQERAYGQALSRHLNHDLRPPRRSRKPTALLIIRKI